MGLAKVQQYFLKIFLLAVIFSISLDAFPAEDDDYDEDLINEFIKQQVSAPAASEGEASPSPTPGSTKRTPDTAVAIPFSPQTSVGAELPRPKEVLEETAPCVCVKYFLCNIDNGTVVDNGNVVGLIDIRLGRQGVPKTTPCDHYFDICCQTTGTANKTEPTQNPLSVDTDIRNPKFKHSVCGKRNIDGVGFRITGATDQEAQFGEFPWMAAIVKQERQEGKQTLNVFLCGGSLIHPRIILTAAHCVVKQNVQDLKVRLGEWDTQTPDELYPHDDRYVVKIIIHEEFYPNALYNDIALLILNEDVNIAPNIDTVCLPPANLSFEGQRCYATGWGKDSFGQEGKYQVILKKIDLPIVPTTTCENSLRRTRLGRYFRLHDSFVCAGGEKNRDTCRGDGGSPLVCKVPGSDHYVQVGIVAWGIGCGEEGIPGVYVNVPKFVPWITRKMTEANFDTKFSQIGNSVF